MDIRLGALGNRMKCSHRVNHYLYSWCFQRCGRFHITEQVGLSFRAEFFNIFNHPNFGNPNKLLTSPLFGHSTQTLANSLGSGGANGGFNQLYQIGGPRSIQLALKLQF